MNIIKYEKDYIENASMLFDEETLSPLYKIIFELVALHKGSNFIATYK